MLEHCITRWLNASKLYGGSSDILDPVLVGLCGLVVVLFWLGLVGFRSGFGLGLVGIQSVRGPYGVQADILRNRQPLLWNYGRHIMNNTVHAVVNIIIER